MTMTKLIFAACDAQCL